MALGRVVATFTPPPVGVQHLTRWFSGPPTPEIEVGDTGVRVDGDVISYASADGLYIGIQVGDQVAYDVRLFNGDEQLIRIGGFQDPGMLSTSDGSFVGVGAQVVAPQSRLGVLMELERRYTDHVGELQQVHAQLAGGRGALSLTAERLLIEAEDVDLRPERGTLAGGVLVLHEGDQNAKIERANFTNWLQLVHHATRWFPIEITEPADVVICDLDALTS